MKDHADIHKLLSAYCGGDLEPARKTRVEEHLAICPVCRADLADLKACLRLIRGTPEVEPPPWMTSRIMARLREETAPRRRWYQWIIFPPRTKLPLEVMALLIVCVSGYYLSRNLESQVNTPTALQEMPAMPSSAKDAVEPVVKVPAPAVTSPKTQPPEKQGQPSIKQSQRLAPAPAAPTEVDKQAPQQSPSVSDKATAPPLYAPAPPINRLERAAPASGAGIESMAAKPTAEQNYQALEAAPERRNAAKKAARAPMEQALPTLKLRLAISDLSSANQAIRQAVTRSGGVVDQAVSERHVKLRISKDRLPELLERLGHIGKVIERPAPPNTAGMLEVEISW